MGVHVVEESRIHGVEKLVVAGTVCAYPEAHTRAVQRGRFVERLSRGDQRALRRREEGLLVARRPTASSTGSTASTSSRPTSTGRGDNFDLETSHVIPALIRKMRRGSDGTEVVLWGDGIALARVPLCRRLRRGDRRSPPTRYDGAEPVNLGTGDEITIRELAETIARLTGFEGEIAWDTSMPNGQPRRSLDARARDEQLRLHAPDRPRGRARAHGRRGTARTRSRVTAVRALRAAAPAVVPFVALAWVVAAVVAAAAEDYDQAPSCLLLVNQLLLAPALIGAAWWLGQNALAV